MFHFAVLIKLNVRKIIIHDIAVITFKFVDDCLIKRESHYRLKGVECAKGLIQILDTNFRVFRALPYTRALNETLRKKNIRRWSKCWCCFFLLRCFVFPSADIQKTDGLLSTVAIKLLHINAHNSNAKSFVFAFTSTHIRILFRSH